MGSEKMREIRISLPEELFTFMIPPKTQEHLFRAGKEFLLALRSLIDARIEFLDKKAEKGPAPKKKIKVE